MAVLRIGNVDITPYIAYGGLEYQESDIDASDSGRTMDAVMHRGRVASKTRLDVKCRPLTDSEVAIVLTAIMPEWVTVEYHDPITNTTKPKTLYSNNRKATSIHKSRNGTVHWDVSFPLIEQ